MSRIRSGRSRGLGLLPSPLGRFGPLFIVVRAARGGSSRLNDGAVHIELLPIDASFGVEFPLQMANDGFERPIFRPSAEAVIDGLPVAIAQIVTDLMLVAPRGAGAQNPEDAVEHLPVVLVRAAAPFDLREHRFDAFKLLVGQLVATARHIETADSVSRTTQSLHTDFLSDGA